MSRRPMFAALLLPVLLLIAPGTALAGPREDMYAAWQAFLALKSFRATLTVVEPTPMTSSIDFQAPDRFRMRTPQGVTMILVGDVAYMDIAGRAVKLPLPVHAMTAQYRDESFLRKLQEDIVIEDLGPATLDGQAVRKYRYVHEAAPPPAMPGGGPVAAVAASLANSTTVAWIATGNHRILRLDVTSRYNEQTYRTEITYSNFNDPAIIIEPPQ